MTRRRRPTATGAPASGDRYIDDDPDGERARVRLSKLLDRHLRLDPTRLGIELDAGGWTDLAALVATLSTSGASVTAARVRDLVLSSEAPRFEVSRDGERIRSISRE